LHLQIDNWQFKSQSSSDIVLKLNLWMASTSYVREKPRPTS